MGMSATIIAATVLATKALSKPPKMPDMQAPPTPDDAGNAEAASAAGQRARRRVIGASGRSDTILTGAQGLGDAPSETGQAKTLLGL